MNLKLLIIFSIVFLILDVSWIQIFAKKFGPMIEKIQGSPMIVNVYGALGAYIVMLFTYYNIIYDGDIPNYTRAALLGLAVYGTYEFTNYATIKNWDLTVLLMDICWGSIVGVLSLYITNLIYKRI
jgi:uncharacterized membrane protein